MVKKIDKNILNAKRAKGKIITIVSAVLFAVLIVCTIVCGTMMPKREALVAADGGNVSSIAATEDNHWYYATSNSTIVYMQKDNTVVEEYSLKEAVEEKYKGEISAGNILSLSVGRDSGYIWVYTTNRYLFQLRNEAGLALINYTYIEGDFSGLTEDETYLYIISKPSYYVISKYDVTDISKPV